MATQTAQTEIISWEPPMKECTWTAGLYPASVKEIHDTQGKHGPMKRVIFSCINEQLKEFMDMPYTVGTKVTTETKAGKLLIALGFKEGSQVTWEMLKSRQGLVLIEPETYENKKGEKVTKKCITKVLPFVKT